MAHNLCALCSVCFTAISQNHPPGRQTKSCIERTVLIQNNRFREAPLNDKSPGKQQLDRLKSVLDSLVDTVITMDESGRILDVNSAVEQQLGYTPESLIGRNVKVLMPEPYASEHDGYLERYLRTGRRHIIGIGRQVKARRIDGSLIHVSLAVSESRVDGQRVFAGVLRDITVLVKREAELRRQRDELAIQAKVNRVIEQATDPETLLDGVLLALISLAELEVQSKAGLFLLDAVENQGAQGFQRPLRSGRQGLRLAKTYGEFTREFLEREAWIPLGACLCGRAAQSGEVVVSNNCFDDPRHEHQFKDMTAHGHYIIPLKSAGEVIGVIFLYTDPAPAWDERRLALFEALGVQIGVALDRLWTLEELHQSRAQLYRLATQDSLTGLANRRSILERLNSERALAERTGDSIAIILLDLDRFKRVNDTHGHAVGDDVLVETARRLMLGVRPYDVVGRLGGEEFLIVLPHATLAQAETVAQRIRGLIKHEPMRCQSGVLLSITASLGVTEARQRDLQILPDSGLIEEADCALYRAKAEGRDRVVCYHGSSQ